MIGKGVKLTTDGIAVVGFLLLTYSGYGYSLFLVERILLEVKNTIYL
jgi:hypothetical protein